MSTRPRPPRTATDLRNASIHVHYELRMLTSLARRLSDPGLTYEVKCAFMNSFAIHARALDHFLWPGGRVEEDDVLAVDFFPHGWTAPERPHGPPLDGLRTSVNKFIVHITYSRPPPGGEKDWSLSIAGILAGFVDRWRAEVARRTPQLLDTRWHDPRFDLSGVFDGSAGTGTRSETSLLGTDASPGPELSACISNVSSTAPVPIVVSTPRTTNSTSEPFLGGHVAGEVWVDTVPEGKEKG